MMFGVQVFEALARYVRVDLSRGKIAVPEQHLHDAQIGAMIQQMRREGVAQGVRRQVPLDTGCARIALDDVPEGLARHALTAARGEQVVGLTLEQNLAARTVDETLQPVDRLLAERNESFA